MQIGSGWTSEDDNGALKAISLMLDETVCELYPQLKGIKFALKPIPKEQRKTEKSPGWRVVAFVPEEQRQAQATTQSAAAEEEIPL